MFVGHSPKRRSKDTTAEQNIWNAPHDDARIKDEAKKILSGADKTTAELKQYRATVQGNTRSPETQELIKEKGPGGGRKCGHRGM